MGYQKLYTALFALFVLHFGSNFSASSQQLDGCRFTSELFVVETPHWGNGWNYYTLEVPTQSTIRSSRHFRNNQGWGCGNFHGTLEKVNITLSSCEDLQNRQIKSVGRYHNDGIWNIKQDIICDNAQHCKTSCAYDGGAQFCYKCRNVRAEVQKYIDDFVNHYKAVILHKNWAEIKKYNQGYMRSMLGLIDRGFKEHTCGGEWIAHPVCHINYLVNIFFVIWSHLGDETYLFIGENDWEEWKTAPAVMKEVMKSALTARSSVHKMLVARESVYNRLHSILPDDFPLQDSPMNSYMSEWIGYIRNGQGQQLVNVFDILRPHPFFCEGQTKRTPYCSFYDARERYELTKFKMDDFKNTGNVRIVDFAQARSFSELDVAVRDYITSTTIIDKIDDQSQSLSEYFQGLNSFDRQIAEADVEYLNYAIGKNNRRLTADAEKIGNMIKDLQSKSTTCQLLNILENTLSMAVGIAGAVVGGGGGVVAFKGVKDVVKTSKHLKNFAKASEAMSVAVDVTSSLLNDINTVITDENRNNELIRNTGSVKDMLTTMMTKLEQNAGDIAQMEYLVKNVIENGPISHVKYKAEQFISSYGSYTPSITKTDLVDLSGKYNALLDSLESTFEDAGLFCSMALGDMSGKVREARLVWQSIESLLEDIYDQQFELIDAIVKVIRGKLGESLSSAIAPGVNYNFEKVVRYMMDLRNTALELCNVNQYMRNDFRDPICREIDNVMFLTDNQRNQLAAIDTRLRQVMNPAVYIDRDIYIPVSTNESENAIQWSQLVSGKRVEFRIPENNSGFMETNKWTIHPERVSLIQSMEIFLPGIYAGSSETKKVQFQIEAIEDNVVINGKTNAVRYSIKTGRPVGTYFSYIDNEASSNCPSGYMNNVYCNSASNTKGYCLTNGNGRFGDLFTRSLPVSMYSTFSIQLKHGNVQNGALSLSPPFGNTLKLRARIKVFSNPGSSDRRELENMSRENGNVPSCCGVGQYYDVHDRYDQRCRTCPAGSMPTGHGSYCSTSE